MAETAYSKRMSELQQKTTESNTRQISSGFGLRQRPLTSQAPALPTKPEQPDDSYKDSDFFRNVQYHRENDPHFADMLGQFTSLATGLRQQVESGYMPKIIAQQRLTDYVHDSANHRRSLQPLVDAQQNQQQTIDAGNSQLAMAMGNLNVGVGGAQSQPNGEEQSTDTGASLNVSGNF